MGEDEETARLRLAEVDEEMAASLMFGATAPGGPKVPGKPGTPAKQPVPTGGQR
jgi:hypothetical protein